MPREAIASSPEQLQCLTCYRPLQLQPGFSLQDCVGHVLVCAGCGAVWQIMTGPMLGLPSDEQLRSPAVHTAMAVVQEMLIRGGGGGEHGH